MDELLAALPFPLFNEWAAFDLLEPLNGNPRLEWMLGNLTAQSLNLWRKRNQTALQADDFIPRLASEPHPDPEVVFEKVKFWALSFDHNRQAIDAGAATALQD